MCLVDVCSYMLISKEIWKKLTLTIVTFEETNTFILALLKDALLCNA